MMVCEQRDRMTISAGHPFDDRLHILTPVEIHSQFREDVAVGLRSERKAIPPKYFYDSHGSLLFEQICQQPEYYLTRTEATILTEHAGDICDEVGDCVMVELGSGSSVKTRLLLDEYQRRGSALHYVPIDISASMLEVTARTLIADYPSLRVEALATDYLHGLTALPNSKPRLVLFLGSNLGNFTAAEQAELFARLAGALQARDYLLLGLDLRKSREVLEPAYNDAAGITAAFNLNLLRRINRELSGSFDLATFSHLAFYDLTRHQIEMHLQSTVDQQVSVTDLSLHVPFRAGETIHTEISRKFDADEVCAQLVDYGFRPRALWTDTRGWFLVSLFRFVGTVANGR